MPNSTHEFFEILGKILLRCWIFGFLLLLLWFGAFMSGVVYKLHGPLMDLTNHDLNVIHYCGMAFAKLVVLLFFFFPWLAIRLVLRNQSV